MDATIDVAYLRAFLVPLHHELHASVRQHRTVRRNPIYFHAVRQRLTFGETSHVDEHEALPWIRRINMQVHF